MASLFVRTYEFGLYTVSMPSMGQQSWPDLVTVDVARGAIDETSSNDKEDIEAAFEATRRGSKTNF